jgi:hypothetical protein
MTFLLSLGWPLEEIASRGLIALFLLRFSVRNTASQVAQSLPLGPARWQTIFQTELQRKQFWLLPAFALAHLAGLARKGSAPLRGTAASLKRKTRAPPKYFRCSAPNPSWRTGGQRGRDWRSLTKEKETYHEHQHTRLHRPAEPGSTKRATASIFRSRRWLGNRPWISRKLTASTAQRDGRARARTER